MRELIVSYENGETQNIGLQDDAHINEALYKKGVGTDCITVQSRKEFSAADPIVFALKPVFESLKEEIVGVSYVIDGTVVAESSNVVEVKYNVFDTLNTNEEKQVTLLNEMISFFIK